MDLASHSTGVVSSDSEDALRPAEALLTPALGVSHFFPYQVGVFLCLKTMASWICWCQKQSQSLWFGMPVSSICLQACSSSPRSACPGTLCGHTLSSQWWFSASWPLATRLSSCWTRRTCKCNSIATQFMQEIDQNYGGGNGHSMGPKEKSSRLSGKALSLREGVGEDIFRYNLDCLLNLMVYQSVSSLFFVMKLAITPDKCTDHSLEQTYSIL